MTAPIPDDVLDRAIEKLNAGQMFKDVAPELGVHRKSLSLALRRRRGYTPPKFHRQAHNARQFDRGEMVGRYIAGDSVLALSKRYNVPRKTISDHLERVGVQLRDGSRANSIRMSRLSKQERLDLTQAAHDAVRGVPQSQALREKICAARSERETHKGLLEDEFADLFRREGFTVDQQFALTPYNLDFFVNDRIAVEISTQSHARLMSERPHKLERIREARVPLFYIHITSEEAGRLCADQVVADLKVLNALPASIRKHRVVRCGAKNFARVRDDLGRFASVPIPKESLYTVISEETV